MDVINNIYILFLRYTAQCSNNYNIAESYSCVKLSIYPRFGIKGTKALKVLVRGKGQKHKEVILQLLLQIWDASSIQHSTSVFAILQNISI